MGCAHRDLTIAVMQRVPALLWWLLPRRLLAFAVSSCLLCCWLSYTLNDDKALRDSGTGSGRHLRLHAFVMLAPCAGSGVCSGAHYDTLRLQVILVPQFRFVAVLLFCSGVYYTTDKNSLLSDRKGKAYFLIRYGKEQLLSDKNSLLLFFSGVQFFALFLYRRKEQYTSFTNSVPDAPPCRL
jgi:hypothetical protein